MGRFTAWAQDHLYACFMASFLIVFTLASTVVQFSVAHDIDLGFGYTHTLPTPEERAVAEEPARLASLRRDPRQATREALAYLTANAWVDAQGTTVVRLTERCLKVSAEGKDTYVPFAIAASRRLQTSEGNASVTRWTLAIETASWREIATLTAYSATTGAPPAPATFSCPGIAGGTTLTASAELKEVTLIGLDGDVLRACDATVEAIAGAVAPWCATWHPTATCATWTQTLMADFKDEVWKLSLKLDDEHATDVLVSISMADHTIDVKEDR